MNSNFAGRWRKIDGRISSGRAEFPAECRGRSGRKMTRRGLAIVRKTKFTSPIIYRQLLTE